MSFALGHFALGALLTAVLVAVLFPGFRYQRTLVLLGGGWALIPDLEKLSPVYTDELARLHDGPWADLFWFHGALDRADPADAPSVTAALFCAFVGVTLLAELYASYRSHGAVVRGTTDADEELPSD